MAAMLAGAVEVDETYVGGKPRNKGPFNKRGRGTSKQPVVVLVARNCAGIRCRPVERVDGKALKSEIAAYVDKDSVIMTDELSIYRGVGKSYSGGHEVVDHKNREYSRITQSGLHAHTNTAESFFALLKRGHYGIYHQLSKRHLHRYCDEFAFRWYHRHMSDGDRMLAVLAGAEGKRLTYR